MSFHSHGYFITYRCLLQADHKHQMAHAWHMKQNLCLEQVWGLTQTHRTLGSEVQPIPLLSASGQQSPRLCLAPWQWGILFLCKQTMSARAEIPSLSRPRCSEVKKVHCTEKFWGRHPSSTCGWSQLLTFGKCWVTGWEAFSKWKPSCLLIGRRRIHSFTFNLQLCLQCLPPQDTRREEPGFRLQSQAPKFKPQQHQD